MAIEKCNMNYKLTVTLAGIKGFFRIYRCSGDTTLYALHKQIRADLEFPQDQQILFKALSSADEVVARYALFDLGSGTVDRISLDAAVADGSAKFVYFYDVTNKKSVNISIEEDSAPGRAGLPVLVESKGPNPIEFENGYVAFEDLPEKQRHLPGEEEDLDDDEDFDDEEEEEADEDGAEIFDESGE
ncbi:MAG: hypothetical protein J6M31_02710 [Bacteroidales bacterium]|nr:hypothetical protein [Bacteroidales bacterium]